MSSYIYAITDKDTCAIFSTYTKSDSSHAVRFVVQLETTESIHVANALRPKQNGHHFSDDIFNFIFLSKHRCILMRIPLKYIRKGSINNTPALF